MVDPGVVEDEQIIEWYNLFENLSDDLNFDFADPPTADGVSTSPDSGCSLSIDDIEHYLMNDESNLAAGEDALTDRFFSDVILGDLPVSEPDWNKAASNSPESVEVVTDGEEKEQVKHDEGADVQHTKENGVVDVEDDDNDGVDDDPTAKKQKRQMRNRDAAVRSRERKKMYVRDLEIKSKYFEAECKRLGFVLQCCLAENQALRLSLHNSKAFDASMTKQESAVLFLESLLLGSLLGFLGIICLSILPSHLLSTLEVYLLENVDSAEWQHVSPRKAPPRKAGSKVFRYLLHSFMMGKRCKASRSRMKLLMSATEVSPATSRMSLSLSMVCH